MQKVEDYPKNLKKYCGYIEKNQTRYSVRIRLTDTNHSKTFYTYEDAVKHKKFMSDSLEKTKNPIYVLDGVYYMKLSHDKLTIIDFDDLDKIDNYMWYWRNGYVVSSVAGPLHRYILDYHGTETIDHINRNPLDNRKENLRIVSMRVQRLNQNKMENLSETNGVFLYGNKWKVVWVNEHGHTKNKLFAKKDDAIDFRKNTVNKLAHYQFALENIGNYIDKRKSIGLCACGKRMSQNAEKCIVCHKSTRLLDAKDIRDTLAKCKTLTDCAKQFNVCTKTLRRYMIMYNIPPPRKRNDSKPTDKQINARKQKFDVTKEDLEELINSDLSMLAIGRKFGVSDNAIRKRCTKFGLDWKNRQSKCKT